MPTQPSSFFIVPSLQDAVFDNDQTNSQGGISFGVGIGSSTNVGSLSVLGTGTPSTNSPADLTLRVQDSGSLNETTFLYKQSNEADSLYKGEHDRRYSHLHSTPFPYQSLDDPNYYGYGMCLGYVGINDTEFVVIVDQYNIHQVVISYRQIATSDLYTFDGGWNKTTLNLRSLFNRGIDSSGAAATAVVQMASCTLQTGKALIFVRYNNDIDVYTTSNGITWQLIAEQILGRFLDIEQRNRITLKNLQAAASSNFVKIALTIFQNANDHVGILTSSDNGLTWTLTDKELTVAGQSSQSGFDRYSFSLCSLGNSGGFLLANANNVLNIIEVFHCNGANSFSKKSNLSVTYPVYQTFAPLVALCEGVDSVILFLDGVYQPTWLLEPVSSPNKELLDIFPNAGNTGVGNDKETFGLEQNIFEMKLNQNIDTATFRDLGQYPFEHETTTVTEQVVEPVAFSILTGQPITETVTTEKPFRYPSQTTGFQGVRNFKWQRLRMIKIGAGIALCTRLRIANLTGNAGEVGGLLYLRYGGFDTRPTNDVYDSVRQGEKGHPINNHQQTYILFLIEWYSWCGSPAGVIDTSENSKWALYRNVATMKSFVDRLLIMNNGTVDQQLWFEYRPTRSYSSTTPLLDSYVTPERNWFFATNNLAFDPVEDGTPADKRYKWSSGCVLEWCVNVSSTLTEPSGPFPNREGQCAIYIEGYRFSLSAPTAGSSSVSAALEIRMFKDSVFIFDHGSNSIVETLNITTTGRNLSDSYFEFKLAIMPVSPTSNSAQYILQCRPLGSSSYVTSAKRTVTTTSTPITASDPDENYYQQRIKFGMLSVTNANITDGTSQNWKYVRLHPCNDFDLFAINGTISYRSVPNILRGFNITNNLIYLQDGQSVLWSGSSGAEADTFELKPEYANSCSNILHFDNPRQQWRSAGLTDNIQTVFSRPTKNGKIQKDFISGFSIIGTNATSVQLASQVNSSSSFTTQATINLERARARVTTTVTEGQTMELEFDSGFHPYAGEFQSGRGSGEIKYYARFGTLGGGSANISLNDHHEVLDHFEDPSSSKQNIQLSDLATNSTIGAGTTLIIYGDRGYACFSGIRDNTSYRIKAVGTANEVEGYLYAGTICVGNTLQIDPVLNWQHTVAVQSNNTEFKTRAGIEWSYNEGPSRRQLNGTIVGDVTEQMRNRLKNTIRRATDFNSRSLLFVLQDGVQDTDMIYYGKVEVGTNENAGYYYDTEAQQWRSVGNMTLTIIENT